MRELAVMVELESTQYRCIVKQFHVVVKSILIDAILFYKAHILHPFSIMDFLQYDFHYLLSFSSPNFSTPA